MFRCFIFIYGISLTAANTIKVSGQVEFGNQLSKLLKELYSQLTENGMNTAQFDLGNGYMANQHRNFKYPHEPEAIGSHEDSNTSSEGKRNKHKGKRKHKEPDERDTPILDKMMQNNLEKLHLYGYHKFHEGKPGEPLNNVHL